MPARNSAIRRVRRASWLKMPVSQSYTRLKVPKPSVQGIRSLRFDDFWFGCCQRGRVRDVGILG